MTAKNKNNKDDAEIDMTAPQPGPRRRKRKDASLYREVAKQSASGAPDQDSAKQGRSTTNRADNKFRFVLQSDDPAVVRVDHQAMINELTGTLDAIEASRDELEQELNRNNRANKLQIAQIKGRLADLNRKKTEIEGLLLRAGGQPESAEQD